MTAKAHGISGRYFYWLEPLLAVADHSFSNSFQVIIKKQNALPGYGRTFYFYGPRGIRTLDLSDANRTLSQQSRFCAHLTHREKSKINVYSSI